MNLNTVVQSLRTGAQVDRAVRVLSNFNHPLHERERDTLAAFMREYHDKVEAGSTRKELIIPADMEALLSRPLEAIPAMNVVMCVLGATKMHQIPSRVHRQLQKVVLPKAVAFSNASHVKPQEWATILVNGAVPLMKTFSNSIPALRCVEELLKFSLPALANHLELEAPNGASVTEAWATLCSLVVSKYATLHAAGSKHGKLTSLLTCPEGGERFMTSIRITRLVVALTNPEVAPFIGKLKGLVTAAGASAKAAELVPVAALLQLVDGCAISKNLISAAVKHKPGFLSLIIGGGNIRVASNTLLVADSEIEDTILYCLYTLGLTTTSTPVAMDLLTVLQALPPSGFAAYVDAKGVDVISQIVNPFINNTKIFSVDFAPTVAEVVARIYSAAGKASVVVKPLATLAAQTMSSRCRSGDEKASMVLLVEAMVRAISVTCADSVTLETSEVTPLIRTELNSTAVAASRASWALVAATNTHESLAATLTPALKNIMNDETLRRSVLTRLPLQSTAVASCVKALLQECGEVETYRTDALLALGFAPTVAPQLIPQALKHVLTCDVVAGLTSRADLHRAVESAISLAAAGYFDLAAFLMTHGSGYIRSALKSYFESIASNASMTTSLWDAVVRTVFGLESTAKPDVLPGGAFSLVVAVAPLLLRHTAKLVVHSALAEVVLCCGHDHVVGSDPTFFMSDAQMTGLYRSSAARFDRSAFDVIFAANKSLFSLHNESITSILCQKLSGAPHVASAAARGLSLMLRVGSSATTVGVFGALKDSVEQCVKYFIELSPLDAAIASGLATELNSYQKVALTQKGLLKEYTPKPPKGVSEEDYEDMKRKDAIALKAGQEALAKEISKRQQQVEPTIRANSGALVALRVIGASHGCKLWDGIPIVYPVLLDILSRVPKIHALYNLAFDAIVNLLHASPLRIVAGLMASVVSRVRSSKALFLTPFDVATIANVAQQLRAANIVLLPPPLFAVFVPFCSVAFKSSTSKNAKMIAVPTQHQLMAVLNANVGQEHLPAQSAALSLLCDIIRNFPGLFKTVQNGAQALMAKVGPTDLTPVYSALMNGVDVVKECMASAFVKFDRFASCRTAQVVAAVMQHDESTSVNQCMTVILKQNQFELEESDWDELLPLLESYGRGVRSIGRLSKVMDALLTRFPASQEYALPKIIAIGKLAAVKSIEHLVNHYSPASTLASMEFLCKQVEHHETPIDLMQSVLATGKILLQKCTLDTLQKIAPQLQLRLKRPPPDSSNVDHKEQYLAIAVVWLTVIGCRLDDTAFLESVVDQQAAVLNTSNSADVHYFVCDCMAEIAANKNVKGSQKLITFAENCLKVALTSGAYVKKKAHACGLAGVIQGLGLLSIRKLKVIEAIQNGAKEKQAQRSGAMILIEVLCDTLGYNFEPYALVLTPLLLEAVAEKDAKISECADDAAKAMMRNLSDIGLRQLIPRLVQGLQSDQTKKRTPALAFIGYVAFCSPKQLAATLPNIMRYICECLFDANSSVSNAAYTALKRVAGVVSNPEIQEHVDAILSAMRLPSTETESALDALLYTRFVNAVDPASLALIIPVILRGLSDQMKTKAKAAQITASMVSLVSDQKSLLPYIDEMVLKLQNAAQDPLAEVRTTSAKAISSLTAIMSDEFLQTVTDWVFHTLRRSSTSAEKAGAAQVLAEVISARGESVLSINFATIQAGMEDPVANVREGFLHLMIYAPSTIPQAIFQNFLPLAFPWVLRGLSDLNERVRTVALTAGSGIIGLYGTRNLALVLTPLLEGVISEVGNLRHSSMLLASKLLIHLVNQIKKKLRMETAENEAAEGEAQPEEDAETEDTSLAQAGEIRVETARDAEKRGVSILGALEEQIGHENFIRILAAMHIGRSEHNLNVRTDCTTAWQICVASPRAAMTKIFSAIITMLIKFASSDNAECVDVAEQSIEYTCARLNENVERFVDRFSEQYQEGHLRHRIGALTCLACVVQFADSQRLMKMGGQIVACVMPGMQDEDESVRNCAGLLFERVSKVVGSRLIESVVETQLSTSIRGVVEVVKVRPSVALAVIFKNLHGRSTYTLHDVDLISSVLDVEQAEEDLPRFFDKICDILLVAIGQNIDGAEDVMTTLAEMLPEHAAALPLAQFQKAIKNPTTAHAALRATGAYAMGVDVGETDIMEQVIRIIIAALGDVNEDIRESASRIFMELMTSIERRVMDNLEPEEKEDIMIARRVAGRFMLQYLDVIQQTLAVTAKSYITSDEPEFPALHNSKLFDAFVGFYGKVLEWGTDPQRVQAVEAIQDVFAFAPKAIAAAAAPVTAGRCTKILFGRTSGSVVLALVQICSQLLRYTSGMKEKLAESNLAMAMFNAVLCDSSEARTTALKLAAYLVSKSPLHADVMISNVHSKRTIIDAPPLRAVACRFTSFIMRVAKLEKPLAHVEKVLPIIRGFWESPETGALAAAAGSAMGSLCISATVKDNDVEEIANTALRLALTRGVQAAGGISAIYSLLTSVPHRLPAGFVVRATEIVKGLAALVASDKLCSAWVLRVAARLATMNADVKADTFYPLLRRVGAEDEHMMSTAKFFCDSIVLVHFDAVLEEYHAAESSQWLAVGRFDADLDDDAAAEVILAQAKSKKKSI